MRSLQSEVTDMKRMGGDKKNSMEGLISKIIAEKNPKELHDEMEGNSWCKRRAGSGLGISDQQQRTRVRESWVPEEQEGAWNSEIDDSK